MTRPPLFASALALIACTGIAAAGNGDNHLGIVHHDPLMAPQGTAAQCRFVTGNTARPGCPCRIAQRGFSDAY